MRVLLIEDDTSISSAIALAVRSSNINLTHAELGCDGIDLATTLAFDLIILDLGLPDMTGIEVLQSLRKASIATPVLVLSGYDEISRKVKALTAGADDYLTKPFHGEELMARIRAIARRGGMSERQTTQVGDLLIDHDMKMVEVAGKRVSLTSKEFQIVSFLATRPGFTLSKEMILDHLYAGMDEPELKIVDVFICKCRKKLAGVSDGRNYIQTVWGRGYMLSDSQPMQMAS